jgi:apyrase
VLFFLFNEGSLDWDPGTYKYGKEQFKAVAAAGGADVPECKELVLKGLQKDHACESMHCTFGGVWSGGGGGGQADLLVASFFFDKAAEVGTRNVLHFD